jgi:hypothetical protein
METPHYFDTLDEKTRLNEFENKAKHQDDRVLAFMRSKVGQSFTPAEVWKAIDPTGSTPLTSIRRAMTNLATAELLIHLHDKKKKGLYGRDNDTWIAPMVISEPKLF